MCIFVSFESLTSARYRLFVFNDTATTEIYTLSLHDALPISPPSTRPVMSKRGWISILSSAPFSSIATGPTNASRSEEHTSELQSRQYIVCRLLLEKKTEHIPSEHCCPAYSGCAHYHVTSRVL